VEPNSNISNMSFKIRDAENQIVYQYEGPSSGLEAGILRTLNNSCGNENTCEAPYNLKATVDPENDRNIILTWDSDHAPEFGYNIYRDGFLFNMAHELQYIDENTDIGGHCYYVTALCTGGETANSNEYCATSGTGCEPPVDLYYTYTTNNKVQLNWSAAENENVTGYVVYRKTDDTPFKRIKNLNASTLSYKDNTAAVGTTYQYAVTAFYRDIDCNSAYANDRFNADRFFVEVDWSNAPRDLQAVLNDESTAVNLQWRVAYQATSYDIMRDGVKIGEATETVFEDQNIEIGNTYCYQVVAHGTDFQEFSNEACVTTAEPPVLPCSAPVNLAGELDDLNTMHVTWEVPEDRVPDGYELTRIDMIAHDTLHIAVMSNAWEESCPIDMYDMVFQVQAIYPECLSEFALTENGEDFVRFSNLSVGENVGMVGLYPNPTSGLLTIEAENMTIVSIYNLVGQCLMENSAKDGAVNLDLNSLQSGVYLVKVSTSTSSVMQKVIKI
jgi:hypothetical protein